MAGHVQDLPIGAGRAGISVLVGVRAGEQSRVLGRFWDGFGAVMGTAEGTDVVVDCGRLWPDSAVLGLVQAATTTLLVMRPDTEGVVATRLRAEALFDAGIDSERIGMVVVGDRPYGAAEVAEAMAVPAVATIATDQKAARLLGGQRPNRRLKLARSPLLRSARSLADELAGRSLSLPAPERPWPRSAPSIVSASFAEGDPGGR